MAAFNARFAPLFSRHGQGSVYTIAGIDKHPGALWFVGSTVTGSVDSGLGGRTPDKPFATLAYALASASGLASGDVIYLMPGHAENIAGAAGIASATAGVRVVGVGVGAQRATFTFTTDTAASWTMAGANTSLENVLITTTGTADFVIGITVSGADVQLVDVEMRESAADSQWVTALTLGTTATRAKVTRFKNFSFTTGDAADAGILISAAADGIVLSDIWLDGVYAHAAVYGTSAATNLIIKDAIIRQRHASAATAISLHASTTGAALRVYSRTTLATGSPTAAYVGAAFQWYDTKASIAADDAGTSGRSSAVASVVSKAGLALSNATISTFTIAGGEVFISKLWLKVTTGITTDTGSVAANNVPTAGNTIVLVTATDLGTTDSVAGTVIGLDRGTTAASKFLLGGRVDLNAVATTGVINLVGTNSVNGTVTAFCEWYPLVAGATLVAS